MPTRTPIFIDENGDINELPAAQLTAIQKYARYLYSQNPSVTLSYTASGGTVGTINDTRRQSGDTFQQTGPSYPTTNAFISFDGKPVITVGNAHININKDLTTSIVVDSSNVKFPCYLEALGDSSYAIRSMTDSDFIDTFCVPALQAYRTTDTTDANFAGIYHVQTTTTYSGSTLVDVNPIFVDTGHDGVQTTTGQPTDQPTDVQNYYLFLKDNDSTGLDDYNVPSLLFDSQGDVSGLDSASFVSTLAQMVRWTAVHGSAGKITYQYNSGNAQRGSSMLNTQLNSNTYTTAIRSAEDYEAQYYPTGTRVSVNTYYLGITVT